MAVNRALARSIRQSPAIRSIASRLAYWYISLVTRTTRWDWRGKEPAFRHLDAHPEGLIAAIWHGRLFMSATFAPLEKRQTIAMISSNYDGQLITDIVAHFRVPAIRGSSYDRIKRRAKGGARVYEAARDWLDKGAVVAISPDGPRGPRMRAQPGMARLAIETGCGIIPVAFSSRWGRYFNSWDRFLVPFPFAKGAIIYGDVLMPPKDPTPGEERAYHLAVERALTEVTNLADDLCGRRRIEPGPAIEVEDAE
ncbi:MAG: lysophospholipid acyltransferase family protein [Pseudomonadota bacterium]